MYYAYERETFLFLGETQRKYSGIRGNMSVTLKLCRKKVCTHLEGGRKKADVVKYQHLKDICKFFVLLLQPFFKPEISKVRRKK